MKDLQGDIVDRHHYLPIRVYYEDTDMAGIVYYANYLKYAERGRTELCRALGFNHPEILSTHGIMFVVKKVVIDYLAPAQLDDKLIVRSGLIKLKKASILLTQDIMHEEKTLVTLEVKLGVITQDGKPQPLPAEVYKAFNTLN